MKEDYDRITTENAQAIVDAIATGGGVYPLNTNADGTAYTITTRTGCVAWTNLLCGGGHYPSTSVLEICTNKVPPPTQIRVYRSFNKPSE